MVLALVEEDLVVKTRALESLFLIILSFSLETGRLAASSSQIDVLLRKALLFFLYCQFLGDFVHSSADHLHQIRVGVSDLILAFEHEEEAVFNGVLVPAVDELGHFGPFLAQLKEEGH